MTPRAASSADGSAGPLPLVAPPPHSRFTDLLAIAVVLVSLGWLLGVPRQLGLALFTEQVLALALGLCLALAVIEMTLRSARRSRAASGLAALVLLGALTWIAVDYPALQLLAAFRPAWLTGLTALLVGSTLVLLWRSVGAMIALVVMGFVVLALAGPWFGLPATAPSRLPIYLVLDANALLGLPLRVAVEILIPFILFAEILRRTGGGDYLTNLALACFGRYRGGSAKAAVGASALFGSISGNAVSNVVGTGMVTIGMMRRSGYKAPIAGAVEAAASTGGQLLPPVMGSAAFVMADYLRVPYSTIMAAAILPALLYFTAIFIQVDRLAARDGIGGLAASELPPAGRTVLSGLHFLLPFAVLIVAFVALDGRPQGAVLYALAALVAATITFAYDGRRLTARTLLEAVVATGSTATPLVLVTAAAGILIGVVSLTGIGFSLAGNAVAASGGNVLLLLVLVALAAIVLGMGMPTVAVYVVLATVLAPALAKAGVPDIQAHLFILYFGMLSMLTPPVALASITAARIAEADFWRTSFEAVRLAWVAYLIPFVFAFSPALVLRGTLLQDALAAITAIIGITAVSIAAVGHLGGPLGPTVRIAFTVLGLALFLPADLGQAALLANFAGAVGLAVAILLIRRQAGTARPTPTRATEDSR